MANFIVTLSMCGYRDGKHFTFIPARLRKSFTTATAATKYYNQLAGMRFKPSENYGVFLSIIHCGKTYKLMQIN